MKTRSITPEELEAHFARHDKVPSQKNAALDKYGIPLEAMEMIAAKDIRYYMGPKDAVAAAGSGTAPAVEGQTGLSVYVVECPPGQGPMLHAHMKTRETFFCCDGRFEVLFGDKGEHVHHLDPLDMVTCPLGVSRAFRNVSDQPAHLLVMIQGEAGDMADIAYAPEVGEQLDRKFGPGAKAGFEKTGITFDAGV